MSLTTYLHSQLAATGFCIVDASMAYLLRPDLFSGASAASGAIMTARKRGAIKAANATEHVVELKGRAGGLQLLARFTDGLEARIAETTGLTVTAIRSPARLPQGMREAQREHVAVANADRVREAKVAKLRELADQELPAHDCAIRKQILAARRDLAYMGEPVSGFVAA